MQHLKATEPYATKEFTILIIGKYAGIFVCIFFLVIFRF